MVGTEATGLDDKKALPLLRALSRTTRAVGPDDGAASTPSLHTPVTVPFLWEDAPGRPKPHSGATAASSNIDPSPAAGTDAGGGHPQQESDPAKARLLMPLKLPPRLQFPSTAADSSLSPRTVLQGPYGCTGGARRPPRTAALRRDASFRRAPSTGGGGFFSRRKMDKKELDAAAPDASPSLSSSSSSSSASFFFFFGDDLTGGPQPGEGECAQASVVRITRFRRNRSFPSMTTSHLWASIRKSIKQITPWS